MKWASATPEASSIEASRIYQWSIAPSALARSMARSGAQPATMSAASANAATKTAFRRRFRVRNAFDPHRAVA